MITEIVKASEKIDGKLVFVGEMSLQIAESINDLCELSEGANAELTEAQVVQFFNASRRIDTQRKIKAGQKDGKPSPKATVAKLVAAAKGNEELAKLLREAGFSL